MEILQPISCYKTPTLLLKFSQNTTNFKLNFNKTLPHFKHTFQTTRKFLQILNFLNFIKILLCFTPLLLNLKLQISQNFHKFPTNFTNLHLILNTLLKLLKNNKIHKLSKFPTNFTNLNHI